ncbi:DUF6787 family protein [Salinimicrobium sediminilitoris]|jgi:hypothetical protein|uniref:DUF6787 family protein n=1 Tax=Salinimicrobium sediminilitoris TaxID=2876715 RepID=UPI001E49CCE7|nr:DUF6787 family protein [Salinimicrobium sediminilitoris]MCC8358621.1 diacylglyceryl transferase [Salinimicrobium sediminilitoris]
MNKLKQRWGISSNWQILIIFIVFGLTGSSSLYVAKPALEFLGLTRMNFSSDLLGGVGYYALRILMIFPVYQVLLVTYGWIFGQFRFFWQFEKNMLSRLGLGRILK